MKHWNILWDGDECAILSLCVCNILWCVCEISWCVYYKLVVCVRYLVICVRYSCYVCAICADRGLLLIRTPSPVPLRTCICSTCWDQPFRRTCRYFPDYALRTSIGTFSILFGHSFTFTKYSVHFKYTKKLLLRCINHFESDLINNIHMDNMCISGTTPSSVILSQSSF